MSHSWIGVDLDGTLAHYDTWRGLEYIGAPVPAMVERVLGWLERGERVKIFTARAACPLPDRLTVIKIIQDWLEKHGMPRLEVTATKDYGMVRLYDDRAIRVEENTGRLL